MVWAVDHGGGDITTLMRDTVAAPIFEALAADNEMPAATYIDGRTGSDLPRCRVRWRRTSRPSW